MESTSTIVIIDLRYKEKMSQCVPSQPTGSDPRRPCLAVRDPLVPIGGALVLDLCRSLTMNSLHL